MPEYIVGPQGLAPVTPETWLSRFWLSLRTLRAEETGLDRAEAEAFLRGQAVGNPSAALRRRCWKAMEQHGVRGVGDRADAASD
jgi:hypothetical protein